MLVAQSCPTLCDPMNCSLPGSSVHGILQARIPEWVAISFSKASSPPRDQTQASCIAGRFFTLWATRRPQWQENSGQSTTTYQRASNKTLWWWSWSQKEDDCLCVYLCHQWNRWVFLVSINQGRESHSRETGLMIMGQNSIGTGNSGLFLEVRGQQT